MLANVMLAGEGCQKLSGPADGNICSVFLILLIDRMLKHRNTFWQSVGVWHMPPFPLNSGFLSIREIERDQYLCITNNHPVSERIKTTESPCQSPRYSSGISQNQYIEMGKRFYLARATFVLQFSIYQFSTPVRLVCITLTQWGFFYDL